jgi:hypothetical protein
MAQSGSLLNSLLQRIPSVPIANYGFINKKDLRFQNASEDIGLAAPGFSNGAAYADLDGDGDLDLLVNNINQEAFIYRNTTSEKLHSHFIKVQLSGFTPNTIGIGTVVTAYANGNVFTTVQMPSRGFQSSVDPVLHFGLGLSSKVDSVVAQWNNGKKQILYNIKDRYNSYIISKRSVTKYNLQNT